MTLTTPVLPQDFDAVCPGEQWFFYWRTSASLWQSKLEAIPGQFVVVPLNWAFHSETGEYYDFAREKPETNLRKLVEVAKAVGKHIIFLMPVTPFPFLPNGGLPHILARNLCINELGEARAFVDSEGAIHKLYSYFDPRVFQAFARFCQKTAEYFSIHGIACDVYGVRGRYFEHGISKSMMLDRSNAFEKGFSRFLEAKKREGQAIDLSHPAGEQKLIAEYEASVEEMYVQTAKEELNANWGTLVDIGYLGASPDLMMERICSNESPTFHSKELFSWLCRDALPSSILLPSRIKKGNLLKQLDALVTQTVMPRLLTDAVYEDQWNAPWKPLTFFEVFKENEDEVLWERLALWQALDHRYRWCYRVRPVEDFKFNDEIDFSRVIFLSGKDLNDKAFGDLLKVFMSGGKVVLNRTGIDILFLRRFETFFLENSLKVEKINFHTMLHNITLGEGRLLIFQGEKLPELKDAELSKFWNKILETYDIVHVDMEAEEGVDHFWRVREAKPSELSFEEIRRLNLYNSTSYRKKVEIRFQKTFALLKLVDETNVRTQSGQGLLQIEILPGGSVAVDFGVYS
ncbi:MAG: hypothetical protein COW01_08385 [Bdellovibrionales bacterium CG12_big_fil_rev_8_21_14_0_65_38_15]|nr:MAG: hypothetical protein COW01_08385 [Bdellovibrionales bacterium CG12_big_fil_rev_8_21_14_0_65_38_15]